MKRALCLLLVAACSEPKPALTRATEPRKVELVRALAEPLGEQLEVSGTLAAQDEVVVRTKVAGRLASLGVDLGSAVKAGQPIAQIEPVDYRLRVAQAEAALGQARALLGLPPDARDDSVRVDDTTDVRQAQATQVEQRANYARAQQLLDKKLIGRAEFEANHAAMLRAESAVQRAREEVYGRLALLGQRKAELGLARQQLADTTLRSPLTGVVQLRTASAGEFLTSGDAVATVVRIDPLRLRVAVPERDAARVALGQAVTVEVEDGSYTGQVARISPALDAQNRTLVIEAELPNPGDLRPGSFARARIRLGQGKPVIAIPESALVVFAGIEKVITVSDGRAVEQHIETGRRLGGRIEVTSGLQEGAQLVRAPGSLQHGDPVLVVAGADAKASGPAPQAPQLRVE